MGNLAIVQMLYGAREGETMLEVSNSMDLTPLHRSAMYGHQKTAAFLLEKGCDMYRLDRVGRNALDYARLYNCTENNRPIGGVGRKAFQHGFWMNTVPVVL